MSAEYSAVRYLGISLIFLIIGITICVLASLGYRTYISYQDEYKKIEVKTDSNLTTVE